LATPLALERRGLVGADGLQPLVDLGVDPRHEERRHRTDSRQVDAGRLRLLETVEVSVDDLAVTLEAEDQGHVDADALGGRRRDGAQALEGRGDLDHDVLAVDSRPELFGLGGCARGVVGESGLDLDRDAPVFALRGVVHRTEDVARGSHVRGDDLEHRVVNARTLLRQLRHLVVVRVAGRERVGEDRRVGGDADDVAVVDEALQATRHDAFAREVVEPDADSDVGELLGLAGAVCHGVVLFLGGGGG